MAEPNQDLITEALNAVNNILSPDNEEQEFLDRLWSFGEGYFDLSIIEEILGKSGETGSDRA